MQILEQDHQATGLLPTSPTKRWKTAAPDPCNKVLDNGTPKDPKTFELFTEESSF